MKENQVEKSIAAPVFSRGRRRRSYTFFRATPVYSPSIAPPLAPPSPLVGSPSSSPLTHVVSLFLRTPATVKKTTRLREQQYNGICRVCLSNWASVVIPIEHSTGRRTENKKTTTTETTATATATGTRRTGSGGSEPVGRPGERIEQNDGTDR